jgi:hypothetical protein
MIFNRSHWFLIIVDKPRKALDDNDENDENDSDLSDSQEGPEIITIDSDDDSQAKVEEDSPNTA